MTVSVATLAVATARGLVTELGPFLLACWPPPLLELLRFLPESVLAAGASAVVIPFVHISAVLVVPAVFEWIANGNDRYFLYVTSENTSFYRRKACVELLLFPTHPTAGRS